MKPARVRPLAEADLIETTRHYRREAGPEVGERFFDAAFGAIRRIEGMPGAGSPRLGELCHIPGLRSCRIDGFPYGWFYLQRNDHVDVVRLLSYARDLPALLKPDEI